MNIPMLVIGLVFLIGGLSITVFAIISSDPTPADLPPGPPEPKHCDTRIIKNAYEETYELQLYSAQPGWHNVGGQKMSLDLAQRVKQAIDAPLVPIHVIEPKP